jgi:RNA polymerase-binding transcription factor DksA
MQSYAKKLLFFYHVLDYYTPMTPFVLQQKLKLIDLRDSLIDNISFISKSASEEQSSGLGEHLADAGSDAYDREFALSVLSKGTNAFIEIENALKRIESGRYGVCEMSGDLIPQERLEALPFARFTVQCQSILEKTPKSKQDALPLFFSSEEDEEEVEVETEEVV